MIEISPGRPESDQDGVAARCYAHPALAGRPVVRLVADIVGQAEDLALEYLGFEPPERVTPVGATRREALGFPAWALVNDPTNGHHALNLVKELARLSRVARSKPGNAKDELVAIGDRLGRSAPRFLPSFYEQTGRMFLEQDNITHASVMFSKAREAERVHALEVDPGQLRDVYLEFSLAGALTGKHMTEYVRWLMERYPPDEAYEQFWTLCLQRIRGGLSPYAGMPKDIRRLAKAAGRDLRDVDDTVLRELLGTQAVRRASKGFWESYRDALVSLANRDPAVRERLVGFVPDDLDISELWLEILVDGGVIESTTRLAAWLGDYVGRFRRREGYRYDVPAAYRSVPMRELVVSLADRLRAEGVPVDLRDDEPDLFDLCVAVGIPLGRVPGEFPLHSTFERDLTAVAADERFHPALLAGMSTELLGKNTQEAKAVVAKFGAIPGLRAMLPRWLDGQADMVVDATLPLLDRRLRRLEGVTKAGAFAYSPDAAKRISQTDVAARTAEVVRSGLFDEVGWAALDEAVARLLGGQAARPGGGDLGIELAGEGWPALVLHRAQTLVVVGPDGILMEHVLRLPPGTTRSPGNPIRCFLVDERLMVCWRDDHYTWQGYWSDDPTSVVKPSGVDTYPQGVFASIALPGGGRFVGDGVLHAGDTKVPMRRLTHGDGDSQWRVVNHWDYATREQVREWHPAQLPAFLAGTDPRYGWIRPAAPGTSDSPLGVADGVHGWRVTKDGDAWVGEGVDGARVRLADGRHVPVAGLRLPGRDRPLAVAECGGGLELFDVDDRLVSDIDWTTYQLALAAGTPLVPPLDWWHCLRPRDEQGSLALRGITDETASALLDARDAEDLALDQHLPQVTHPALVAGLTGVIGFAAGLRAAVGRYQEVAAAAAETPVDSLVRREDIGDELLKAALRGEWEHNESRATVLATIRQLAELAELAAARQLPAEVELVSDQDFWLESLTRLGTLLLRAATPETPPDYREALVAFLTTLAETGMVSAEPRWRTVTVEVPDKPGGGQDTMHTTDTGFVALFSYRGSGRATVAWSAIQYTSVPGQFPLPAKWTESAAAELRFAGEYITRWGRILTEHGPIPASPGAPAELAAQTGVSVAEASVLLAGAPGIQGWTDHLATGVRAALGLSPVQATVARKSLRVLSAQTVDAVVEAGLPTDPALLWTGGPDVAAMAEAWNSRVGQRVAVPEDVVADAVKAFPRMVDPAGVITAVASDLAWETRFGVFTEAFLESIVEVLRWLAYRLPADSPLRARLPAALATARTKAFDPATQLRIGNTRDSARLSTLLRLPAEHDGSATEVDGWLVVRENRDHPGAVYREVFLRPSGFRPEHRATLAAVGETMWFMYLNLDALDALQSNEIDETCGQGAPAGYLQDPMVTVPDLVRKVAEKYTVDEDSAVLYLQLLALPDPTDANVARWTGWKPARLKKARAALAETDLVLAAKRSRAGRSLFLPGGWLDRKSPALPIEAWKTVLMLDAAGPSPTLPVLTIEGTFRAAWDRVEHGDLPTYQELRT
ncbi:hypothetical protein [Actinocrispum wychmicini]|uniref:DNA-binding protein n=1 Tax=Actinocrispum wychmicini TaxID=1213861 RepID=A0A4R2JA80_9PSEU|nr:hypothetical protein [Actinocrispum wychmicini]TCO52849.1 hypothetical protein EV192_11143 [Actinocrispum wychmicini]